MLGSAGVALLLAGCSKPAAPADGGDASQAHMATATASPPAPSVTPTPAVPRNTNDPAAFVPLQSGAVKDAIHRALDTGQSQRWSDGKLSGYAVPSQTTGLNGCRAVRYTVDQRPGAPFESITACDATPGQ